MSPVPSDFEDGSKDKTLVKLRLMSRHVSSILVAPRSEPFSDLLSPPPHYQNQAFTFAKLVLAAPQYITQEILQKDIDAIQHERKEISDLLSSIRLARQLAREPSPSPPSSASSSLSSSNPWHRNPIVPPPKPPSPTLAPLPPESESSSTELFYLELAVSKLQSKLESVLESIASSPTIDVDKIVSVSNEVKKKMVEDELKRRENERIEMNKHEEERKLAIERELKRVQKQLRDSEMYEPAFSDEEYYDISHEESYPTESEMEDDEPIFDYSPPGSPMVSVSKSRKTPKNVSIRISKDDSSNSSSSAATSPTFINPSSSSSSSKHSANATTKSTATASAANAKTETFYFYQHAAGLYIYLHPLDIKILKHEFGNYNLFPDELTVKIVSVQETTMDEDLRRKCRYLSHLPKGCDVGFVEVDLNGVVGKETLEAFKDELSTRIHRRKSKFQQEEKARRLVERKLALQQSESSPRMVPSPGTAPSFPSLSSSFPGSSSLSLDYYNMGSGFGDGEVPSPVLSPVEFPAFPALSNRSASDRGHDRVRGKDKEKQRVQSTSTNDKSLPIPVASSSTSPSSNPSSNTVSPVDSLLASSSALYPTPSSPLSSSLTNQQPVNTNSSNPWNSSTRTSFAKIVGTGYNGVGSGGSSGSMKWEKQSVKKSEESKNKIEVQLDWGAGLGGLVVEQSEIEKDRNLEKRDGESGFKNDETEEGKVQASAGKKKKKGKVVLVSTGGARRY
ncbi:hypothetical protein BKA69DRAFT_1102567 [Paraphysoderma sedebokerense]|nr:hypothetical protein BKA69DRAFT_1102567 [Paraphysoderma sedebokerense]